MMNGWRDGNARCDCAWSWPQRKAVVISLCVVVVACLQMLPFTEGYRRTADEVEFLDATTRGWTAIWAMTEKLAVTQGRLGFWLMVPLNALASHFADIPWVRVGYVALHFCVLALFAFYFSLVTAAQATAPLLLVALSLQPLCGFNEYMPPLSYPLQNSLPFLVLLAARCVIVVNDRRAAGGAGASFYTAYGFTAVAMLTTEYAFLLATSLMMAEHALRLVRFFNQLPDRPARPSPGAMLKALAATRMAKFDALCVAVVLGAYWGYRLLHPSAYEGNVLDGAFDAGRVVLTAARHAFAGTALSHDLMPTHDLPWRVWLAACLIVVTTLTGLLLSLPALRLPLSLPAVVLGCAGVILYVSFPIAANGRQQRWCLEEGACGYLDSRLSYLAVAVFVLGVLGALSHHGRARAVGLFLPAAVISLIAALTFMDNWRRSRANRIDAEAWERAALLACHPQLQPHSDMALVHLIDPHNRVPFHPMTVRGAFWRRILEYRAASGRCSPSLDLVAAQAELLKLRPTIAPGQTVRFSREEDGARYLGHGWSAPEPHGVWSDGPWAEIHLIPLLSSGRGGRLALRFTPYFGPSVRSQVIDVFVDDVFVDRWELSPGLGGGTCCERFVDLPRVLRDAGPVTVSLRITGPRTPSLEPRSRETRLLGIALHAVTLMELR